MSDEVGLLSRNHRCGWFLGDIRWDDSSLLVDQRYADNIVDHHHQIGQTLELNHVVVVHRIIHLVVIVPGRPIRSLLTPLEKYVLVCLNPLKPVLGKSRTCQVEILDLIQVRYQSKTIYPVIALVQELIQIPDVGRTILEDLLQTTNPLVLLQNKIHESPHSYIVQIEGGIGMTVSGNNRCARNDSRKEFLEKFRFQIPFHELRSIPNHLVEPLWNLDL